MNIALSDDEAEVLEEVLHNIVRDMSMEIADTDTPEYRRRLRERRELLQNIRNALSVATDQ